MLLFWDTVYFPKYYKKIFIKFVTVCTSYICYYVFYGCDIFSILFRQPNIRCLAMDLAKIWHADRKLVYFMNAGHKFLGAKNWKISIGAYSSKPIISQRKGITAQLKRLWNRKKMSYKKYVRPWSLTPECKHGDCLNMYKCEAIHIRKEQDKSINRDEGWGVLPTLPHLRQPVRPKTEQRTAIRQTVPTKAPVEAETSRIINKRLLFKEFHFELVYCSTYEYI